MSNISYIEWQALYTFGIVWVLAAFGWVGVAIINDIRSYFNVKKSGVIDFPGDVKVSDLTIAPALPQRTTPSLFGRILVPVDDSKVSNMYSQETEVLIVYAASGVETQEKFDSISKSVESTRKKFEERGIRTSSIKLSSQKLTPSDTIAKVASDYNVDAIIMGTHGSGFFHGTLKEVVDKVKCPVIAIPPGVAS
jgi:nucleotide-binding universal stress UspA family protein